jgi:hypothetical protein
MARSSVHAASLASPGSGDGGARRHRFSGHVAHGLPQTARIAISACVALGAVTAALLVPGLSRRQPAAAATPSV